MSSGDRGGDRGARGEEVEEGAPVAVARNRVVVVRGADGDGGRDAGRGADGGDVAVVAGRDHGRHALRQEGVDAGLAHVPVARGAVDPAAEAHVRGDDAPLRVRGVEGRQLVERAELVGGVGRDAGGRPAAGGGGVEAGEDLHRDDPRARSDSRYGAAGCPGAETGRDARDMGAVVAEADRAARAAGERVDVGAVVLGRAVGAQRLLAGGHGRRRAVLRDDAAAEERVVDVDPRVEDRDRASGAGEAARVGVVGPDDRQRAVEGEALRPVDLHGAHVRRLAEPVERGGGHRRHEVGGAAHGAGDLADAAHGILDRPGARHRVVLDDDAHHGPAARRTGAGVGTGDRGCREHGAQRRHERRGRCEERAQQRGRPHLVSLLARRALRAPVSRRSVPRRTPIRGSVSERRAGGTVPRSAGRPVGSSWARSGPRCAGRSRP